jgi:hypothetical protein
MSLGDKIQRFLMVCEWNKPRCPECKKRMLDAKFIGEGTMPWNRRYKVSCDNCGAQEYVVADTPENAMRMFKRSI